MTSALCRVGYWCFFMPNFNSVSWSLNKSHSLNAMPACACLRFIHPPVVSLLFALSTLDNSSKPFSIAIRE